MHTSHHFQSFPPTWPTVSRPSSILLRLWVSLPLRRRSRPSLLRVHAFRCSRCSGCRWCPVRAESEASGGVFPVVPVFLLFLVMVTQLLGHSGRTRAATAASVRSLRRIFRFLVVLCSFVKKKTPLARVLVPEAAPSFLPL